MASEMGAASELERWRTADAVHCRLDVEIICISSHDLDT
jgi:hypothetical protein